MVAGTRFRVIRGAMKATVQEVEDAHGEVNLFVDERHTWSARVRPGAVDASNMLKPALARGELRCIGATTLNSTASTSRRTQP